MYFCCFAFGVGGLRIHLVKGVFSEIPMHSSLGTNLT